jgi:adrenodoxin-NADP+ reductase
MSRISTAKIDMYESMPVPFGLVRFGVAPDHPEVKVREPIPESSQQVLKAIQNCQEKFEQVATSPNFAFFGNVSIGGQGSHFGGHSVELRTLIRHYHAIVFAYGAAKDRELGISGESSLKGIYSARQFVGWYNGLPDSSGLAPDLTQGDEAVIIGQGNVALDVARMLLENIDILRKTDIAASALEQLAASKIKRVHVIGRRGPMQVGLCGCNPT